MEETLVDKIRKLIGYMCMTEHGDIFILHGIETKVHKSVHRSGFLLRKKEIVEVEVITEIKYTHTNKVKRHKVEPSLLAVVNTYDYLNKCRERFNNASRSLLQMGLIIKKR